MNEQETVGATERTCPQCGAQVAAGVKFCGSCGTLLEEMDGTHGEAKKPTCPKCGAEIAIGKKFCVKCGAQVIQFCPSCGAEQILGEPFCGTCGASMSGAAGAGSAGLKPVGFKEAWKRGWKFSAQGRASLGEYWWRMLSLLVEEVLLAVVVLLIVGIPCEWDFDYAPTAAVIVACVVYALWFVPMSIALVFLRIRRLHDQGLSGWWVLLWNTPPAPPIIGLFFSLRSGTRGPNQFGPVPGIRPDELQDSEAKNQVMTLGEKSKVCVAGLWDKAGGAELRFGPKIRMIFMILAGCLATVGLFGWTHKIDDPPWYLDVFRTFLPFVGLLLLAWPKRKAWFYKAGVLLGTIAFILSFFVSFGGKHPVLGSVWSVCLGVFLWAHLSKRQQVVKICTWFLAIWCLLWCFNVELFWEWERWQVFGQRALCVGQCILWGLIALKEGRPGLGPDSQEPEERQVG